MIAYFHRKLLDKPLPPFDSIFASRKAKLDSALVVVDDSTYLGQVTVFPFSIKSNNRYGKQLC